MTGIIVTVALTLAVGATILGIVALSDVSAQSAKSCEVQNRGLKATKEIIPVWEGINFLVEPHAGVRQPPIAPLFADSIHKIRVHLPVFLALEKAQPNGRSC